MLDELRPNATLLLDYWKPVVGYEKSYEVSLCGYVRRVETGRTLKPFVSDHGYLRVKLSVHCKGKVKMVHRLVMEAFTGSIPAGEEVNHLDGAKRNNRHSNLEYTTGEKNIEHAVRMGLVKRRLGRAERAAIRALENLHTRKAIAKMFGVSDWTVRNIHRMRGAAPRAKT